MNNQDLLHMMNAIGWTLLHSIWQIIIIGGIAWLIFRFVSRDNAKTRYGVSILSLAFIFIGAFITFLHYAGKSKTGTEITHLTPELLAYFANLKSDSAHTWQFSDIQIEHFFPWIVNIWMAGVCILSIQMTYGYLQSIRIKKHLTFPVSQSTKQITHRLIDKFNLKQKISIKESGYIQTPALIGYFKPVILLPISMISGIPNNQLEIIIAHELAHIKRHDYLVQFIQGIIELIFFYHPVVWWLSSVVNTEREHICDDLAVKVCGESLTLIKALNNMEAIRKKKFEMILGLSGKKDNLLYRVQRILRPKNDSGKADKILLSGLFILLFSGLILVSNFAISGNVFSGKQFFTKINVVESKLPENSDNKEVIFEKKKDRKKKDKDKKKKKAHAIETVPEIHEEIETPEAVTAPELPEPPEMPVAPEVEVDHDVEMHIDHDRNIDYLHRFPKDSLQSDKWVQKKASEIIKEQTQEMNEAVQELEDVQFELNVDEMKMELKEAISNLDFNAQEFRIELEEHQKELEEHIKELSSGEFQKEMELQQIDLQEALKEIDVNNKLSEEEKLKLKQKIEESISKINTEEFRENLHKQLEKSKESLKKHQEKIKTEAFEARFEAQKAALKKQLEKMESPEFQKEMKKRFEESKQKIKEQLEKINTPEYRKQLEERLKEKGDFYDDNDDTSYSNAVLLGSSKVHLLNKPSNVFKKGLLNVDEKKAPIIVIDGKIVSKEKMDLLHPNDIDRMEVIKGAAAIETYGNDAKNGVIIVKLKAKDAQSKNILNTSTNTPLIIVDGKKSSMDEMENIHPDNIDKVTVLKAENATAEYGNDGKNGAIIVEKKKTKLAKVVKLKSKNGDGEPIIFLDGKKITPKQLRDLDESNLESVSVYKGDDAIERFGKKAKNGVIEISSKKTD